MAGADFTIYTSDSRILTVTVKDQAETTVDLTGGQIKWILALNDNIMIEKSIGSGIAITNAVAGQCQITIAVADTENLTAGSYTHEARLTTAQGSSVIFQGVVTVKKANV